MRKKPERDRSSEKGEEIHSEKALGNRAWRWIKDNSDALKIIFAILAGLFAIIEYKSKDYVDRVKNSSDVVEKFYASQEFQSLLKIEQLWDSEAVFAKRKALREKSISSQEYRSFVLSETKAHYGNEIVAAIHGFKTVAICVLQGRCEPSTVCMYLSETMEAFRCDNREYIAELSADAGSCRIDEVNYILDNYCSDWMAAYLNVPKYSGIKDNYCLYNKEKQMPLIGDYCVNSIIYKKWLNPLRKLVD